MPAYLLTWNPDRWPWGGLAEKARVLRSGGEPIDRWSCGSAKSLRPNDRFFMLKQGRPPRGIVASGWIASEPFVDEHWDLRRRGKGVAARYVNIRFDTLLVPEKERVLGVGELTRGALASVHWKTQMSGIRIPEEAAVLLEGLWKAHLQSLGGEPVRGTAESVQEVKADAPEMVRETAESEDDLLTRISAGGRVLGAAGAGRKHKLHVEDVLELLAGAMRVPDVIAAHPWLEPDDVRACILYARRLVLKEHGTHQQ